MHLVEVGERKVLLDCGLYLGHRPESRQRNRDFPFTPADLDAVVISHAHIDHCGNLPGLVRQGFDGPIYCTPATRDLLAVMLRDSAKIQQDQDSAQVPPPTWAYPLYTTREADRTVAQAVGVPYGRPVDIADGVRLRLEDAGHIIGSAITSLRLSWGGREYRVTYTGDLGRRGVPFLHPPAPIPPADLVISESTYGGKYHPPLEDLARQMSAVIERTIGRGGKVLIPAFSLGRAQIVVHYLQKWIYDGLIPKVPIFVDSPLVADIVEVYRRHPDYLAEDGSVILQSEGEIAELVRYVRTWEESKSLAARRDPCVVVASGGMLDAGRALYHLQQTVDDPRCSIVLVSYQAPQSLGRRLLQKGPTVYFLGKMWNKWADVVELKGFSGHADQDDFLHALAPLAGRVRMVRLVHGEPEAAEALAGALRSVGFDDVGIPVQDEVAWL